MAKPKNPNDLGRQIMAVLNLSNVRKKEIRKHGAIDVRSHFDWNIIAKEHIEYYKSLLLKY
jgi:glycosyltransferase involved in cell wall biosynthesis